MKGVYTVLAVMLLSFTVFALNVYPLVNWVDMKPGEEKTINIRLTAGSGGEKVKIKVKDFVILGKTYIYDRPGYEYSLKDYVEIPSTSLTLGPGEVYEMPVKIHVPKNFPGAQGFAALSFVGAPVKRGNVEIRLNIMTVMIVNVARPKRMDIGIENVRIIDLTTTSAAFEDYKSKYGNFGTLLEILIKNEGNMVFAFNGETRLVSRKLGKIVASMKVSSDEFVVFPDLESTLTLYTPSILPSGKLSILMEGVSQGIRVAKSFDINVPKREYNVKAVAIEPDIMFFGADKPINAKFRVQNLTEERFGLVVSIDPPLKILPPKTLLFPYSGMNFYLTFDPRKQALPKGDNVFYVHVKSDKGNLKLIGKGAVVIRNGKEPPQYDLKFISYSKETKEGTILIKNTGKMVMEFSVIEKTALKTDTLVDPFVLLPGEEKVVKFHYSVEPEAAVNTVLLRYRIYKTEEWQEMKLPWKE